MKRLERLRIKFYYNPTATNKCVAEFAWGSWDMPKKTNKATYSTEALRELIAEEFESMAKLKHYISFDYEKDTELGFLVAFRDARDFDDMNDVIEFDKQCGFNGALVNECKSHLEEMQKQATEALSEITADLAKVK